MYKIFKVEVCLIFESKSDEKLRKQKMADRPRRQCD